MRSLFALLMIFAFMAAASMSRFQGMLMYWWFGLFRPHEWMYWNLDALRLPTIAAAIFVLPAFANGYYPKIKCGISRLMVAWALIAIFSTIITGCPVGSSLALSAMIILIVIVLTSEQLLTTQKAFLALIFTVTVSFCYYSSTTGFYALRTGTSLYDLQIVGGTYSGSNALALGTAMIVFFVIFIIQTLFTKYNTEFWPEWLIKKKLAKLTGLIFLGVLATSGYHIIASESRGSFLAMAAGFGVWVFLHPRRFALATAGILSLAVVLAVVPLPEGYKERITGVFTAEEEEKDKSAASRPYLWSVAADMADDHILGVGPGCYKSYYNEYDETNGLYGLSRSVHSSHFQVIGETGYVGLVVWVWILILSYLRQLKIRKRAKAGIHDSARDWFFFYLANTMITSQTVFILGGAFYELAFNDLTWMTFGMTIAADRLQLRLLDEEKNPPEPLKTPAKT